MRGITLIGMPGSGKSTIGKLLAEELSLIFLDLDTYIMEAEKKSLDCIVREQGDAALSKLEEKYALEVSLENTLLSPGGSIVYSEKAMQRAGIETDVIFLDVTLEEITRRLTNLHERGIVGLRDKSLEELYNERKILYQKYAQYTVDATIPHPENVIKEIRALIQR
jgi:shikimate kinase